MNDTLAIARRELEEKRFVFIAAITLVLLVFAIPLFPRVRVAQWREIYVIGSAMVGLPFVCGLAAILGATVIGRDLSDRRLSFYFTKPVATPAIWFGKVIASALLVVGTFVICMIPGMIAGREASRAVWSGDGLKSIAGLAIFAAILFFIGHVLGTIARARSAWAFVDLAAVCLLGWIGWVIVQPLVMQGAFAMLLFVLRVFGWLLLVAVLATGAWQLARGRTDRLQSYLAMSRFLWPAVAVVVGVCGAIVAWVVLATPADVAPNAPGAFMAPTGDYAILFGGASHRRDYRAAFLIDAKTGAWSRFTMAPSWFSADGRKLLVLRPLGRGFATGELFVRDVSGGEEESTGLTISMSAWPIAFSADGNRVAYYKDVLSIYDIPSKRSLASFRADPRWMQMWFETPDRLRILQVTPDWSSALQTTRTLHISEYNVNSHALRETGQFQATGRRLYAWANADGSRLFVRSDTTTASVLDARSGAVVMQVPEMSRIVPLPDGRIVEVAANVMHVRSPAGAVVRDVPVDIPPRDLWLARAVGSNRVILGAQHDRKWHLELIDVDNGTVVARADDLAPAFNNQPLADPRRQPMNPEQIFQGRNGSLVTWNLATNERKTLVATGR